MWKTDYILASLLSITLHLGTFFLFGQWMSRIPAVPEKKPSLEVSEVTLTLESLPSAEQAISAPLQPVSAPPQMPVAVQERKTEPSMGPVPVPAPPTFVQPEPEPVTLPIPSALPIPAIWKSVTPPIGRPERQEVEATVSTPSTASAVTPSMAETTLQSISSGGGAQGPLVAPAAGTRPIRPAYPIGCRRRGEEGTVVLDVLISEAGQAKRITLITSSGFKELDRSAERATAQAQFVPGQRNGRPVEATARLSILSRLDAR